MDKRCTTSCQLDICQHLGQADLLVVNSLQLIWAQTYLPPPYRCILWTFHISVFVNTTPMVVNSDTIVCMCMEVIICQSDRSPERLMISQTPFIGGHQITSGGRRNVEETPNFWGEFCKTLPTQNRIFLTFQNCGNLDIPHVCICQYDKYSSKKLYSTVHVCVSYDLSMWEVPERLMISQTPCIGRTSNHSRWEKECGGTPSFWDEFCKTLPTQNRIFLTIQNCGILDLPHVCICQYDKYGSE